MWGEIYRHGMGKGYLTILNWLLSFGLLKICVDFRNKSKNLILDRYNHSLSADLLDIFSPMQSLLQEYQC